MRYGITPSQRDIILIPFPYSDLSQIKKRPALVISSDEYNSFNEDVICCAITSNPTEYKGSVDINNDDLDEGFLLLESRIKPNKIFTLSQTNIVKTIGRLNITKSREVVEKLNFFIKIN